MLDIEIDMRWVDDRLKFPESCYKNSSLKSYNLHDKVWEDLWTPHLHINHISKIELVKQLRPSNYMTLNKVNKHKSNKIKLTKSTKPTNNIF